VNPEEAAGQLQKIIMLAVNPTDVAMFVVAGSIWAVILGLILVLVYIVRLMLTILLIAAAPLGQRLQSRRGEGTAAPATSARRWHSLKTSAARSDDAIAGRAQPQPQPRWGPPG
jgi:hypothetical protein